MTDEPSTRQPKTLTISMRALALTGLLLVAGALVLAFLWMKGQQDDLRGEQKALSARVGELKADVTQELSQLGSQVEAAGNGGQEALRRVQKRVTLISTCLTEVQSEINTLDVQFGFASPSDTPSQTCSDLLYGTQTGD